ncbi:MAG: DUF885 domain-containing protein [Chthoniobacterales bacterium]
MKTHSARLRALGERYIERTCRDFPQWGSGLGFSKYEPMLGGSHAKTRTARNLFLEELLAETESLPAAALTGDDWLDRRCFLSLLRTELLNSRDLERWRRNPQECCDGAVGAVFELVIRHAEDLRKARPAIESRLAAIPRFLKEGASAISSPVPLWTKLAVQSCKGAREFVETIGETLAALSPDPARTRRLARAAGKAFDFYASTVAKKKQGKPGDFSIGRERFEYLVRERTGLDWSLPEIEAEGHRLIAELSSELAKEARRHGRGSVSQILARARDSWTPEAPLLYLYTRSSAEWRKRVVKSGLYPIPPGESLKVTPVPDFMRDHFPTAAYSSPGPFEKRQRGIFWVNDLGATKKDPEDALREARQHFGLELTSAHEGYPGHHLQFAIQNRHPSRIRRLCSHAIFYEGWTMWCEKLAVEKGWVRGPHARLQQLHDALWRAYRIVIDCGLHSGKLTHEAAAQVLVKGVGFTPARARADVNWYTAAPTVPMSYLLGRIELERVKSRLIDGEGWTLRKFHEWALAHGAVPWTWIERASL